MNFPEFLPHVEPLNSSWFERAQKHHDNLTKPPRSLGRLEEIVVRLCAIQQTDKPRAAPSRVVVFAGDHGVAREGVSAYPPQVTAQMVANFRRGGAAINVLSRAAVAQLHVIDIGVCGEEVFVDESQNLKIEYSKGAHLKADASADDSKIGAANALHFHRQRVCEGTRSMTQGAALTRDEVVAALEIGMEHAQNAARDGVALLAIGEMGIGNTTSASALTCALTGLAPREVTGRGTGIDEAQWQHKIAVIEAALSINKLQTLGEAPTTERVLEVMGAVGGLEIIGMCGACVGAASGRVAVVVDGFIATCAAALATRLCPDVRSYLFVAHRSTEAGQIALLDILEQTPLLDLQMRLGEGSGAALCLPILQSAVAVFNEMATFQSAGVDSGNG